MMQRNNIEIIPFSPEMAEVVAKIEKECFSEPWSESAILDSYNFNTAFYAAIYDEKVIGYIGVQNIAGEGYVTNVAVSAAYRSNGVGTLLVKKALERCKKNKFSFLTLEVRRSNTAAITLYSKLGFERVGERKNFYHGPDEDAVLMTHYLNGEVIN